MAEHQYTQQPKKTDNTSQKQSIHASLSPFSIPMAIIQRARINPKSLTPADVLQLQCTIGNRAVGRLLSEIRNSSKVQKVPIQRQEILEEEETLQGKTGEPVQRQEIPDEEEKFQMKSVVQRQGIPDEEEPLQGKMIGTIQRQEIAEEEKPLQMKRENNTGIPDNLKAGVESLSGIDVSDVRVHYNSDKPADLGALAYTQGTDIHVAPGQENHLSHEAWHIVQQAQGRVRPTMQMKGVAVNDDAGLEREADVMGQKAFQMYRQVEKPKENKSRAIANSVDQLNDGKSAFQFVDNRPEAIQMRRLQATSDNCGSRQQQSIQKKEITSCQEEPQQTTIAVPHTHLTFKAPAQLTKGRKRDRQKGLDDKIKRLSTQPNFGSKEEPEQEEEQQFKAPKAFRDMEQEMGKDDSSVTPQDLNSQSEKEQVFSTAFSLVKKDLENMTTVKDTETKTRRIDINSTGYQVIIRKAPFGGKNSGANFFILTLKRKVKKGKYRVFGSIVIKRMDKFTPMDIPEYDELRKQKYYDEMGTLDYMSGHPHSPTFHGGYLKNNIYYIGMELATGDLSSKVEKGASKKDLSGWLISTAKVLADMHTNNIAHGDVKGDNVMISKSGYALLSDYGETTNLNTDIQKKYVAIKDDISRYIQMVYKSLFGTELSGKELLKELKAKQAKTKLDQVCILALDGCSNGDVNPPGMTMTELADKLSDKSIWPQ